MSEIKPYKSLKECGLKMMSLLVSFKYHCGIIVTIAFFLGMLPWYAWLPGLMAIASIRGYEKFLLWGKRSQELTEDVETIPNTPQVES